jgi:hypothetical protein
MTELILFPRTISPLCFVIGLLLRLTIGRTPVSLGKTLIWLKPRDRLSNTLFAIEVLTSSNIDSFSVAIAGSDIDRQT